MTHEHTGNPYHLNDEIQHEMEMADEKNLNHIYKVLDEILCELKAIHKKIDDVGKESK